MELIIKEVHTKKELQHFIQFPLDLYANNPYFVPPIVSDEKKFFNEDINPVFQHAWIKKFLCYKGDRVVGRIAVLANLYETEQMNIPKLRFGWFDCIEDLEVAQLLIQQVEKIAEKEGFTHIEGPMGFSNMDKAGMLTYGFDKKATMIGSYNAAYYPKYMEELGYSIEKTWVDYEFETPKDISKIIKLSSIIEQKYKVKYLELRSKKQLHPFVDQLFELIKGSYGQLKTFIPLSEAEMEYYKKKYIKVLDVTYIKCVVNEDNQMVGFAIVTPNYADALQKSKGKLFPFGWIHFLKAKKNNPRAEFVLIGVLPEYQKKGITSILFREIHKSVVKAGFKILETNPQLEDNKSILALWQQFNPTAHKKRSTFIKYL